MLELDTFFKISVLVSDEAIVPAKIHSLDNTFDLSDALIKILVANKLPHRLHHPISPIGRRFESFENCNHLLLKRIRSCRGLRAFAGEVSRPTTIIPIYALLIGMRSHFAVFLILHIARHISDTLSAVDQIAQQIDTMLGIKLVMDSFGVPDFLASFKKLWCD